MERNTTRMTPPAFFHHVMCVLLVGTSKQVIRVATEAIIAVMANALPLWYFTICHLKSSAMRAYDSVVYGSLAVASSLNDRTNPKPTFIGCSDFNIFPKSLLRVSHSPPFASAINP